MIHIIQTRMVSMAMAKKSKVEMKKVNLKVKVKRDDELFEVGFWTDSTTLHKQK